MVHKLAPKVVATEVNKNEQIPHSIFLSCNAWETDSRSQLVKGIVTSNIPTTEAKDSCNPGDATEKGFFSNRMSSAKPSAVELSYSRLKMGAIRSTLFITTARVTDGENPNMAPKNHIAHKHTPAAVLFRRKQRFSTREQIKLTCIPDTAPT